MGCELIIDYLVKQSTIKFPLSIMIFSVIQIFLCILSNGIFACQLEHKRIYENVEITLLCTSLPITEIVWKFNNQSQINSSFSPSVIVHEDSLVILSPPNESVYGDYSCSFTNGTLINCFRLHKGTYLCMVICMLIIIVITVYIHRVVTIRS